MSIERAFHLPWNSHPEYWLCAVVDEPDSDVQGKLFNIGMRRLEDHPDCFVLHTEASWEKSWEPVHQAIADQIDDRDVRLALIPGENEPSFDMIKTSMQPARSMERIARNIWLGKVLENEGMCCYFQTVVNKNQEQIGYESFARVEEEDGTIIGGMDIINASHALNIEHVVDRYLHKEAIATYIDNDMAGRLFLNFIPGFIHRPAIYLQGLNEAVEQHDMPPDQVVLDFTRSDSIQDLAHFRSVMSYCRSRGYLLALDDIPSLGVARSLLAEVLPDYIKLDRQLCLDVITNGELSDLESMVRFAHAAQCKVVAEGVETEEVFEALKGVGVDFFQGYLFSKPVSYK